MGRISAFRPIKNEWKAFAMFVTIAVLPSAVIIIVYLFSAELLAVCVFYSRPSSALASKISRSSVVV
jgi:hypothetical protein